VVLGVSREGRSPWHPGTVVAAPESEFFTVPDLAERFGVPAGRVRRLLDERALVAVRVDGVLRVPADFVEGDGPLPDLRGTILVLGDNGFNDAEIADWLLSEEESLGARPVDALRAGRKAEVRRVAQALA